MDILGAIMLGIIEGLTEFLPISSTGHLILTARLLNIPQTEFVKTFEIAIQSGAILSVLVLYGKTILSRPGLVKRVVVAFIPTALVGFVFYRFIKQYLLGNTEVVLISLFAGGIVLILIELFFKNKPRDAQANQNQDFSTLSYEKAMIIGIFQAISVVPGVSRAAATIIGGMLLGLPRTSAVEFSFLLAIPTMFAATFLDLKKTSINLTGQEWLLLLVGFMVSFLVATAAIKWLLFYVKKNTFVPFGIYRIAISIILFLIIR
ncbi:MAG: undecaprenyl-diphosphatase UppP [Candidatus Levybacteria bacterium RIFCSPHIGHO2_02_FULL_39_36]|nr:MAG: undecaprenyl-diphosphatase UppP [Candidatus Levybacteria bacterium RIFCSPHIGHO2_02_FULL_39_36]OGH47419.1 MAG: undecaprenyl-diphosphatase UppP [Candidatus Levybacteria bacterium RIFCSPLOWO2_12_FULL_39_17]